MKSIAVALVWLVGAMSFASAKPLEFPSQHLKVDVSDDWKVTTESDELFGVTNANDDTFTITVNSLGQAVDVPLSSVLSENKAGLIQKGMRILKEENLSFHGKGASSVLASMTKLGFTFYMYEIMMKQGNDVLTFIMVGDSDPSQQAQFQAILNTVSFDP